jgi:hypothetical protein
MPSRTTAFTFIISPRGVDLFCVSGSLGPMRESMRVAIGRR